MLKGITTLVQSGHGSNYNEEVTSISYPINNFIQLYSIHSYAYTKPREDYL